jgi:metal-dependent amidase/aminoacylase/carboxypeptidase family protein
MKNPFEIPIQFRRMNANLTFAAAGLIWLVSSGAVLAEEGSASARLAADVAILADDSMQGRGIGTQGLERAAELIAERFEELGLKTELVDGGPYQVFKSTTRVPKAEQGVDWEAINAAKAEASGTAAPTETSPPRGASDDSPEDPAEKSKRSKRRPVDVKNVMALLPGEGPLADEVIVVGAHYDHLGYREKSGEVTVFNGANDNASGTAAVLEIARILSQREEKLPRSVLFIAFSAEERGLVGSFFYVKHPVLPIEKTVAMVNLDMVGCMEGEQVMASGSGTSKLLTKMVIRAARDHDLNLIEMPGKLGGSDHVPFYTHEVPVVHFITTGGWKDYHKPTDDVETLDFEGAARISEMAAELVVTLAESEKRPKFEDRGWGGTIVRNLFRFMGAAASAMAEPEEEETNQ